jgi:hypothetical protein
MRWKSEGEKAREQRKPKPRVEKVTGIGQDVYLHSNTENQILSKRLL